MNKNTLGFSLLELMLAMLIGIFLIAGVGTVYVSSKQTYALRDQMSELDENARVAIRALREHIEHAGYTSTTGIPLEHYILPPGTVPSAVTCSGSIKNILSTSALTETAEHDTTSSGGDSIAITYLADDLLNVDCNGTELNAACLPPNTENRDARMVYSSFSIENGSQNNSLGEAIPNLFCGGSRNTSKQPLAQGIEHMQIRYGVDIAPATPPTGQKRTWEVDQYWDAQKVSDENAWDRVALVQVALLVRTVDPAFPDAESMSYALFNDVITTNDRYKRAVYNTTIHLRNIVR